MENMKLLSPTILKRWVPLVTLSLTLVLGGSVGVRADEADAQRILKTMSDYMASQKTLSFGFDSTLEVVTDDNQKLGLASSGSLTLSRPDKLRISRTGGFADIEMFFNGKKLTLLGKNLNVYDQIDIPGTIDNIINELKDTYQRPLPAADLFLSNSYDEMMQGVVDIKDLGVGVVDGVMCDHLAFRTEEVDWQIWVAQGNKPFPYRYVITSTFMDVGPQYTVQMRDWKMGKNVAVVDYNFVNSTNASKVNAHNLKGVDDLPDHFSKGDMK